MRNRRVGVRFRLDAGKLADRVSRETVEESLALEIPVDERSTREAILSAGV
jgi:hypothetical protein